MKLLVRWPDLPLHMKGLIVVAVPAAATVVIACSTMAIGHHFVAAQRSVNHTLRVDREIQRLHSSEVEVSAHVRGYFITGEEEFAAHARESLAAFDVTRQKLVELTLDNPAESQRLDRIAALERSRVEHIVNATTRFQMDALPWDELRAALKGAETERLAIEALLKAIQGDEDDLLEARLTRLESLRLDLRAIIGICVVLGVTGGVVISLLFASGITSRIGRLQKNVDRLATGEVLDPLPQGRDEIGELGEGMVKAAEVLRHRTAALENGSNGVAEADATDHYVDFNSTYRQLTGLDETCTVPMGTATVHPEDREHVKQAVAQMHVTGRSEIEVRVVHPGGRVAFLGMTFVPVSEDREGGYFIFLQDINRRKEAEGALVQAKDAAVAGSLAKNDFLAKISHDIRTPLNAILGAADLLSQSPLNTDQAEYVGMFQRNSRRLVALINDFLDFSKIEAGALHVENVPYGVRETVEEAVATFRELALRKGVILGAGIDADVPHRELGDPLRLHQVLVNLLSNAVKFTQHGRVDVRVQRIAGAEGPRLRFTVSDTGPGIRAEDRQRIFANFEQSGNQDPSSRDGCGLGLTICHQLVELMGGEIGVSCQEGSGSTFHFTLPLVAASPMAAQLAETGTEMHARVSGPSREGNHEVPRVLVAEDTDDNRLLLAHYLRGEPVEVHFVEDGQEAVDAIRSGQDFDLVLMDLDMPVLDGLGAVKAIRTWELEHRDPPIPIVGLSANAMREAVRDCLDAGCAAHVAKPVDKATLLTAIRRYHRSRIAPAPISKQVAELVPKYLASKLQQTHEAVASLAVNDFEPIRRFGHNLKGTGSGYGFPRIAVIGSEIEKFAADRHNLRVSEQLDVLRQFLVEDAGAVPVEVPFLEGSAA